MRGEKLSLVQTHSDFWCFPPSDFCKSWISISIWFKIYLLIWTYFWPVGFTQEMVNIHLVKIVWIHVWALGLNSKSGLEENFDIPPQNRLTGYRFNLAHQPSIKLENNDFWPINYRSNTFDGNLKHNKFIRKNGSLNLILWGHDIIQVLLLLSKLTKSSGRSDS